MPSTAPCRRGQRRPPAPSPKPGSRSVSETEGRERRGNAGANTGGRGSRLCRGTTGRERRRAAREPPNTPRHRSLTCSSGPVVDPTAGTRSHRLRGADARAADLAPVS